MIAEQLTETYSPRGSQFNITSCQSL